MTDLEMLAECIFGKEKMTISDLEEKYPKRNVFGMVTRFSPSPTGFLHTGSLFVSLINYKFAKQTNGLFYVRLEDTDQKREIVGSGEAVINELKTFEIIPDEGYFGSFEKGEYGPYKQSDRMEIYHAVIREMIKKGLAYPCFSTEEELELVRTNQEKEKIRTGYYGKFAKYRNLPALEAIKKIKNGEPFVIRFKSNGCFDNHIHVYDEIRGNLELSENDLDIVIMKRDKLPTYHFAHLVDDHFMRTTHVIRGEEWLPSLPIHLQLFDALGFERVKYAHIPVIMKNDNGKKRKISKRHDLEAAVSFFLERGYPINGIKEYLLTLANSNYEAWRNDNLDKSMMDFDLSFAKFSLDGALFDLQKIDNISKEYLARLTKEELADEAVKWANIYDREFADFIACDFEYFKEMLSIERNKPNPRKDYTRYSDILPVISFFNDDYYFKKPFVFNDRFESNTIKNVLDQFVNNMGLHLNEDEWISFLKNKALDLGFATNNKEYKNDMEKYIGHFGDYMEIIRVGLTGERQSPNMFYILHILGEEKAVFRIKYVLKKIND